MVGFRLKFLYRKSLSYEFGYHIIVEFLHEDVAVAFYSDFGKKNKGCVASETVDYRYKLTAHLQSHLPVASSKSGGVVFRDVVAKIIAIGFFVSTMNCTIDTPTPFKPQVKLGSGTGISLSGKTYTPGPRATTPFISGLRIAAIQPGKPPAECVTNT